MVSKCLSSKETTRLNPPGFYECDKRPIANVVRAVDHPCHFIRLDPRDATYRRCVATNPSHCQLTLLSLVSCDKLKFSRIPTFVFRLCWVSCRAEVEPGHRPF
ncbi:hypothetical protein BYT27DRAFT_6492671 [Phlegmacium glaucopus]|nr:hypothetical protein BYT27DRAFT_6492671 [Phlegmacium glaucopus]